MRPARFRGAFLAHDLKICTMQLCYHKVTSLLLISKIDNIFAC